MHGRPSFDTRSKLGVQDFAFLRENRPKVGSIEQEECDLNEQLTSYICLTFQ